MPNPHQLLEYTGTGTPPIDWVDPPSGTAVPADTVTAETSWGVTPNAGASTTLSRGDHTHGTPTEPQGGGAHAIGGASHTSDTILNIRSKCSDATIETTAGSAAAAASAVSAHETAYSHALLHSNALDHSNSLDHSNAQDHSNTNDPSAGQKAALAGTSGTPADANRYVTNDDSRNADAREPTSHDNTKHSVAYATATALGDHASATTAVHGAGGSTLATTANITTHAGVTATVHGFDASGNAPAQTHDNTRHTAAFALNSDLSTHTGLTTTAHGGLLPATSFSGLVKITVGPTPPVDPAVGDLWVDTN